MFGFSYAYSQVSYCVLGEPLHTHQHRKILTPVCINGIKVIVIRDKVYVGSFQGETVSYIKTDEKCSCGGK